MAIHGTGRASGRGRSLSYKGSYFDSEKVVAFLDRKTRRAFAKLGAYVRAGSRAMLRYTAKQAAPGAPPRVHRFSTQSSSPLRDLIFFAWDDSINGIVIGPAIFSPSKGNRDNKTVPEVLEKTGGTIDVREVFIPRHYARNTRNKAGQFQGTGWQEAKWVLYKDLLSWEIKGRATRTRKAVVSLHPFMAPSLAKEITKLPSFFS